MDQSLLAVIARFPDRGRAVKELAATDEGFRALCADLRDAETALVGWEHSSLPVRDERCIEYRELVDGLADEIRAALDRRS
ncbi:hypothetical protein DWF00_09740 [Bosea caraganae]|uniref:Uncharacterized protein n=2 Tax=Bosea caraganae TaxID=2763117 RepID=A0A370LD20_9HYPH|nr:hypothetical protein DWF00_09740 [Bosea caraganae]RDJ29877.1 hypothetical protein DWE98_01510 [Bosea caraganae]